MRPFGGLQTTPRPDHQRPDEQFAGSLPRMPQRRSIDQLHSDEIWQCVSTCGKRYKKSSLHSIGKHKTTCSHYLREHPESDPGFSIDEVVERAIRLARSSSGMTINFGTIMGQAIWPGLGRFVADPVADTVYLDDHASVLFGFGRGPSKVKWSTVLRAAEDEKEVLAQITARYTRRSAGLVPFKTSSGSWLQITMVCAGSPQIPCILGLIQDVSTASQLIAGSLAQLGRKRTRQGGPVRPQNEPHISSQVSVQQSFPLEQKPQSRRWGYEERVKPSLRLTSPLSRTQPPPRQDRLQRQPSYLEFPSRAQLGPAPRPPPPPPQAYQSYVLTLPPESAPESSVQTRLAGELSDMQPRRKKQVLEHDMRNPERNTIHSQASGMNPGELSAPHYQEGPYPRPARYGPVLPPPSTPLASYSPSGSSALQGDGSSGSGPNPRKFSSI